MATPTDKSQDNTATAFTISTAGGDLYANSLGQYHRYWLDKSKRTRNPVFDRHSGLILSLKDAEDRDHVLAIEYFSDKLRRYLSRQYMPSGEILIVPRAEADQVSPGMEEIAKSVCAVDRRFMYLRNSLRRHTSVPKLALGGPRTMAIHMDSIEYRHTPEAPYVKILLDDVATSGLSIAACMRLLQAHRPAFWVVHSIVMGLTSNA